MFICLLAILQLIIKDFTNFMIKKLPFYTFLILMLFVFSCGSKDSKQPDTKQSQGSLGGSQDEATKFAVSKYGESVKVVYNGDMNANKKDDALVLVINKQFGANRYWIQKGSIIEKDGNDWKTLLAMEEKLKTPKGNMTEQEDAKYGYIVSFKTEQSPMNMYISISDADGRPASDEATIKWNTKESAYEFSSGNERQ
jgi:hypothetical protein